MSIRTDTVAATGNELAAITRVVQLYFEAIHFSDPARVAQAFHPDAQLVGHIGDAAYFTRRDEYMEVLGARPAPAAAGVPWRMEVRSVDVYENAAVVRTLTPIGDVHYVDYLSLRKSDGRWQIVHKVFSHRPTGGEEAGA